MYLSSLWLLFIYVCISSSAAKKWWCIYGNSINSLVALITRAILFCCAPAACISSSYSRALGPLLRAQRFKFFFSLNFYIYIRIHIRILVSLLYNLIFFCLNTILAFFFLTNSNNSDIFFFCPKEKRTWRRRPLHTAAAARHATSTNCMCKGLKVENISFESFLSSLPDAR